MPSSEAADENEKGAKSKEVLNGAKLAVECNVCPVKTNSSAHDQETRVEITRRVEMVRVNRVEV